VFSFFLTQRRKGREKKIEPNNFFKYLNNQHNIRGKGNNSFPAPKHKYLLCMTIVKVPQKHYPRAEIIRRGMALGIDFLGVWLVSSVLRSDNIGIQFAQICLFVLTWLILRVLVVYNNHGQSLGRWAFDLKVLEVEKEQIVGRIPQLQALLLREMIICFNALLVCIGLTNIIANPTVILLVIPLAIDCGAALGNTQMRQALHDRYTGTIIVSSRRGYSLDLKIKRLVEKLQLNVRR
jgi:uncharacterized RDD family membrane protein YckC